MTAVMLAERLDLPAAAPLADTLRQAIAAAPDDDLMLDGTQVTHLGGLCLQVLLAARQSRQRDGHGLRLRQPSDSFTQAVADFGLPADIFPIQEDGA
ncbi:STAS domain-containing protein [Paracoccus sp. p4-l81]|uniref:STAS domain-containing protein n=1 Tax=Paracoccus sp. p4-l81 TaxID=3342806 RepID=UPI0035BB8806